MDTTPSKHMEIIHHPDYDKTVFMPFVPIGELQGLSPAKAYHSITWVTTDQAQYFSGQLCRRSLSCPVTAQTFADPYDRSISTIYSSVNWNTSSWTPQLVIARATTSC